MQNAKNMIMNQSYYIESHFIKVLHEVKSSQMIKDVCVNTVHPNRLTSTWFILVALQKAS
jgi:hypothetical protein